MSFWEKYINRKGCVCVGLDSDITKLPKCVLDSENPIFTFNKAIIDATKNIAASYKPNYAFYASAGKKGIEALEKTLDYIPNEIPVILDVKTGDIGNTMAQYAKAWFEIWNVDSITVNPLMGYDVLKPLTNYPENFSFALALTSNPSAADYILPNGLYKTISAEIAKLSHKNFGAVVGATQIEQLAEVRKLMPETLFLVPGIGAQGGSLEAVINNAAKSKTDPRLLINSSRGIIFASPEKDFAEKAYESSLKLHNSIEELLK